MWHISENLHHVYQYFIHYLPSWRIGEVIVVIYVHVCIGISMLLAIQFVLD